MIDPITIILIIYMRGKHIMIVVINYFQWQSFQDCIVRSRGRHFPCGDSGSHKGPLVLWQPLWVNAFEFPTEISTRTPLGREKIAAYTTRNYLERENKLICTLNNRITLYPLFLLWMTIYIESNNNKYEVNYVYSCCMLLYSSLKIYILVCYIHSRGFIS